MSLNCVNHCHLWMAVWQILFLILKWKRVLFFLFDEQHAGFLKSVIYKGWIPYTLQGYDFVNKHFVMVCKQTTVQLQIGRWTWHFLLLFLGFYIYNTGYLIILVTDYLLVIFNTIVSNHFTKWVLHTLKQLNWELHSCTS